MRTVRSPLLITTAVIALATLGCVPDAAAPRPLTNVVDLDASSGHACASLGDGTVRCWGMNDYLQIGNLALSAGGAYSSNVAVPVTGVTGATQVAVGGDFSCALRTGGTVACWGAGRYGQLGNGNFETYSQPATAVLGVSGATRITAGADSACALLAGGTVTCWGANESGQLGNGTPTPWPPGGVTHATPVSGIDDAIDIDAGGSTTCALLATGIERCWGYGRRGVLGNNSKESTAVPVTVVGIDGTVRIAVGGGHSCALTADGVDHCWGYNEDGRVGDGTTIERHTPATVAGLSDVEAIAAGGTTSCAVRGSGSVVCWGQNQYGDVGDGTTTQRSLPTDVVGLTEATLVSAGDKASCALRSDGTVRCWGRDFLGQLGDGANTDSAVPVTVRTIDLP